jgi:ribosomal protein S18 acetylase RimI-like enzyme
MMQKKLLKIRNAKVSDAEAIFNIQKLTWLDTYPNKKFKVYLSDIEERFKSRKERLIKITKGLDSKKSVCKDWVALHNNDIVGWANIHKEKDRDYIDAIYVLPKYQGKGTGSLLFEKIFNFYKKSRELWLEVAVYNVRAIKFYEKFGFKKVKGSESKHEIIKGKYIPTIKMRQLR